MLRDQIDYQEFCRRGQMQQKNNGAVRECLERVMVGRVTV